MDFRKPTLVALTLLLTVGCNTIGPKAVRHARIPYNVAIADAQDEEFLANLLRVKDDKRLLFLTLSQISTSYALTASATLNVTETTSSDSASLGLGWDESPTATYSPLSGKDFSQRLLSPITLENLGLLYRSGFDAEWIIKLCVTKLGEIEYDEAEFAEAAALIGHLHKTGDLLMTVDEVFDKDSKSSKIETGVHFRSNPKDAAAVEKLLANLGLSSAKSTGQDGKASFRLSPSTQKDQSADDKTANDKSTNDKTTASGSTAKTTTTQLSIETRSLMGAMRLAVSGTAEDPKGLMPLETRQRRPKRAETYVAAAHDGQWYFIRRDNSDAKEIFLLLSYLYTMQAGEPTINPTPSLVIPVG